MCMKNVSTDILFFEEVNNSKVNNELFNLYGVTKEMPEVEVEETEDNMLIIPRISLMLSINATEKDSPTEHNSIDFSKTYQICIRVTETSSGQCVDIIQHTFCPNEDAITLCRKMYNKRLMYRVTDVLVAKPPQGKDLCVFKVLIQEVKDGNTSEDRWIAQSMHPVKMIEK